jgi:hypothetical protein
VCHWVFSRVALGHTRILGATRLGGPAATPTSPREQWRVELGDLSLGPLAPIRGS